MSSELQFQNWNKGKRDLSLPVKIRGGRVVTIEDDTVQGIGRELPKIKFPFSLYNQNKTIVPEEKTLRTTLPTKQNINKLPFTPQRFSNLFNTESRK